jgi:hypothetical protein
VAVGGDGMSLKLLARSWWMAAVEDLDVVFGGLVLNDGRLMALSARDLNCSDQFRPSAERVEE